ncbi:uncharacterized protein LOC110977919 [Acanthaster planci]|uniref:Uncharacterized protein LOC110977919 n=1 Tax=Acanthaster planci TaxID=133434 RepID=A0A8B7Y8S9_ACAPL|nr:uncharacterized protein LOC110977919 [Acanthaster planci]
MDGPSNKIHICNLSPAASHHKISRIFRKFGQITKVFVQRQGATWDCGGQAYIAYADVNGAAKAAEEMDGEMFDEAIISVRLVSHQEFLQGMQIMYALSSQPCGDTSWPTRNHKLIKPPPKTKLTPKDIALAPNSEWEPYIPPTTVQLVLDEDPRLPDGAFPNSREPPSVKKTLSKMLSRAKSAEVLRNEDAHGVTSGRSSHPRKEAKPRNRKMTPCGTHRNTAKDPPHSDRTRRGDQHGQSIDRYSFLRRRMASDPSPHGSLDRDRYGDLHVTYRDTIHNPPRSYSPDPYSKPSEDIRAHSPDDPVNVPEPRSQPPSDYKDRLSPEGDRRVYDWYDAPRGRDCEYERLPATSYRERSPLRHHWDTDPPPSTSTLRELSDDHSTVQRLCSYDDDLWRDTYIRDSSARDTQVAFDSREERPHLEPVEDRYREPSRLDDWDYPPESDRLTSTVYGDGDQSNDRRHQDPERVPFQDSRTLGIDRPTYDYSLEGTFGADRPTYDYSLVPLACPTDIIDEG